MRISYHKDTNGWLWACIHNSDGTFNHWFLGSKDLDNRKAVMYASLAKG